MTEKKPTSKRKSTTQKKVTSEKKSARSSSKLKWQKAQPKPRKQLVENIVSSEIAPSENAVSMFEPIAENKIEEHLVEKSPSQESPIKVNRVEEHQIQEEIVAPENFKKPFSIKGVIGNLSFFIERKYVIGVVGVLFVAVLMFKFMGGKGSSQDDGAAQNQEGINISQPNNALESQGGAAAAAPVQDTELVYAHALLMVASNAYSSIDGYQSQFNREEIKPDGSWDKEKTFIKFEKPFTIFMNWLEGSAKGRQILYSEGNFDDKLMVRLPGFLFNMVPLVSLELDDPRLQKAEKHSIKSAGIGHFLGEFAESFEESMETNEIEVLSVSDVVVEDEEATRIEVLFKGKNYDYPRQDVAFSKSTGLPIEILLYEDNDKLVERYRYMDLALNTPKDDPAFKKSSDRRMFDLFQKVD